MRRRYLKIVAIILLIVVIVGFVIILNINKKVQRFGPFRLGGAMPIGEGGYTFAPARAIPKSKFYIIIGEPHLWCVFDECDSEGALIETMGGWIQGERTSQPVTAEILGLDTPETKKYNSIVYVGDGNSKIVGIYPGKGIRDIASIMKLHSDLIGLSAK